MTHAAPILGGYRSLLETRWPEHVIPVREDKEIRCPDCNRLLMKGEFGPGTRVQVKCTRAGCSRMVSFARM